MNHGQSVNQQPQQKMKTKMIETNRRKRKVKSKIKSAICAERRSLPGALPPSSPLAGGVTGVLLVLCLWLMPTVLTAATVSVLAPFHLNDTVVGCFPSPYGPLAIGNDGNFYGVTDVGAANGYGAAFKVTPTGSLSKIVDFDATAATPWGVVFGADGNLYGASYQGNLNGGYGSGFKVTLSTSGNTLSSFALPGNDNSPHAPVVLGRDGNLYGTTEEGGINGIGTVFVMTPGGQITRLSSFSSPVGAYPAAALVEGSPGVFYGTTINGANNSGTIYVATSGGSLNLLYTFTATDPNGDNNDGAFPNELVYGSDGNLYGTTEMGGANATGTVFKITTSGSFTTLFSFGPQDGTQPGRPMTGLVEGSDGNFYGTTSEGGASNAGVVFKITPSGTLTALASLTGDMVGATKLVQGPDGKFYGTSWATGATNAGCVFVVDTGLPTPHPAFFNGETALGGGWYYLQFANGTPFGYYSYLSDQNFIYHIDLGFEYLFDANDANHGIYFYDFASNSFFYTSPSTFPYLYDFSLNAFLYYLPDFNNPGRYTHNPRWFYNFATGQWITL
jgi:uncharacterized repeat protein (TIGR03803 family)